MRKSKKEVPLFQRQKYQSDKLDRDELMMCDPDFEATEIECELQKQKRAAAVPAQTADL